MMNSRAKCIAVLVVAAFLILTGIITLAVYYGTNTKHVSLPLNKTNVLPDISPAEQQRLDCYPVYRLGKHATITKGDCNARGCQYEPSAHEMVPDCFYPPADGDKRSDAPGYMMVGDVTNTAMGWKVRLRSRRLKGMFSRPIVNITFEVQVLDNKFLRFKFTDYNTRRYEVPVHLNLPGVKAKQPSYEIEIYSKDPFSFRIRRKSSSVILWDTKAGGLVLEDQFLQIATALPSSNVYGFGENLHKSFRHDLNFKTWPMFSRDQAPGWGDYKNLYGVHPFYTCLEKDGNSHGILLLNSNAMEYSFTPAPMLILRSIGGILDFYMFVGPTPENVIQQYTSVIGRPFIPPYWSLGFQLCRYGYKDTNDIKEAVTRMKTFGIPHDVQYADIDYMDERKDFSLDIQHFGDLPRYFEELRRSGMKTIIMLDPAFIVNNTDYKPYEEGIKRDVFIKWPNRTLMLDEDYNDTSSLTMLGYVWPKGKVAFPDFFKSRTKKLWKELIYNETQLPWDGLWIDMNEPANFGTNEERPWNWPKKDKPYWSLKCPENKYDSPPYRTKVASKHDAINGNTTVIGRLSDKTLCMLARQGEGDGLLHYDVHSLYGWSQSKVTLDAARIKTGKRSVVISRSTYPSSGRHVGHWLGDNDSKWKDLHESIIGILEFNLFGLPYVGADVCGFWGHSNAELCKRWMQLGAFYTFSRNHNGIGYKHQDPGYFGAEVAELSKDALLIRYRFLPYLYSLFYAAHVRGNTVTRALFHEYPKDENTWDIDKQFLWGPAFLVSPVLCEKQTLLQYYLPKGRWYNYYDNVCTVSAGSFYNMTILPDTKIPIHIRGGYILPTQRPDIHTTKSRKNPFGLYVALNEKKMAEGELFWDDGDSIDTYETGMYSRLAFSYQNKELKINVTRQSYNISNLVLDTIRIFGVEEDISSVKLNNYNHTQYAYDNKTKVLNIQSLKIRMSDSVSVTLIA